MSDDAPQDTINDEPHCPNCNSANWRCWDEQVETHYDEATDTEYQTPIGYLVCESCGYDWIEES